MDGQVLGGGVIVAVTVFLWLAYLVPSWQSRHRYLSAERNAVRLNQALRVLAESSETPGEVHLELTARTAAAQQRLARQALAERKRAHLEQARAELEIARGERVAAAEDARRERATMLASPAMRRARARRRARLVTALVGFAALAGAGVGIWQFVVAGASVLLWSAGALALVCLLLLQRMSRVARARGTASAPVARPAPAVQDVALESASAAWQPRRLPPPLVSSTGSRAAAVLDAEAAREALRTAARAAVHAAPSVTPARAAPSPYARMGYVDDAEIEEHVRILLSRVG